VARLPSVNGGPLEGLERCVPALGHRREPVVGDVQSQVVAGSLEDGQCLLDERQALGRVFRLEVRAVLARQDPPAQLANLIPSSRGTLGERICAAERFVAPACPEQGVAELLFKGEIELSRRQERGGSLEQAHGRTVVLAEGRAVPASLQAPPGRGAQPVVGQPELGAVSAGLFEVVAEDFVQLDKSAFMLIQPGGIALVEVCARRFRQRFVRGVAD
jgi:hypothetical protein